MMGFVRAIGRWTMTAMVINCIIGAGIFGLPAELTRLLGRASPIAMILAALGMAVIMACIAEVASQFSEPGGPYLYVRTAFGRFLGVQIGWFHLLAAISGLAALANIFVNYLATFLPWDTTPWERSSLMAILIAIPAVTNYFGVRSGANLSNVMTLAKLLPLALLILFGVALFARQPQTIHASEITSSGLSDWVRALVLLMFVYGGWEDGLIPTGEITEPRRTIPFGLATGLLASRGNLRTVAVRYRSDNRCEHARPPSRRDCICATRARWRRTRNDCRYDRDVRDHLSQYSERSSAGLLVGRTR